MKRLSRFWQPILISITLTALTSCMVGRVVFYNFADIKDYKKFPSRQVRKGESAFSFARGEHGRAPKDLTIDGKTYPFEEYLKDNKTVAFLIIQNDSIQYENYFRNYDESSIVTSFSMAKSITSILIGCAIDDKLIQSVNEPVTNYIPELKKSGFDKVTIRHLLQMTSGLKFNEGYFNPFGEVGNFYYGRNLRKAINKLKLKSEPGKKFEYLSGNAQLLGLVLERALKDRTVSSYLEEKIWKPLQMEYDASWSLDKKKNGLEKTFCCINARARDYAKIGRLYLNRGNWNGKQIVSENWVWRSTTAEERNGSVRFYQYQWWIPAQGDFLAEGFLGQFIYVHPEKDLIIVRLGKNEGKAKWWEIFTSLGQAY